MTRQTSIDAYRIIERNGLLKGLQWMVYQYVCKNGPVTQQQTRLALGGNKDSGVITTRFSELKRKGVIIEVGEVQNKPSKMNVYLWQDTGKLPINYLNEKFLTKIELINALCECIEHLQNGVIMETIPFLLKQASKYRKKNESK